MSKKIVTMGEIMLRLQPPENRRFVQATAFEALYGGVESNVAISLATFGMDAYFVTKLPKNEIAQSAVNELRQFGVKTDYIVRGGNRIGIYFLELGASMRPTKVVYDRKDSAMAQAQPEDFDFDEIFKDAEWFHFSGVTPGISNQGAKIIEAALKAAKRAGVTVSVDINYRKKLWNIEQAKVCMVKLMPYVDVFIGGEDDAVKILGMKPSQYQCDGNPGISEDVAEELIDKYGFSHVVATRRQSYSASDNGWSAIMYDGKNKYESKKYNIHIIDRVGGGDSFAAGLIYGLLNKETPQEALEFAVAASALKHTIPGDCNLTTVEEVDELRLGDASGRVQR